MRPWSRSGHERTRRGPIVVQVPGPTAANRWASCTVQEASGDEDGASPATFSDADPGKTIRVLQLAAVPAGGERRLAEPIGGYWVADKGAASGGDCLPCGNVGDLFRTPPGLRVTIAIRYYPGYEFSPGGSWMVRGGIPGPPIGITPDPGYGSPYWTRSGEVVAAPVFGSGIFCGGTPAANNLRPDVGWIACFGGDSRMPVDGNTIATHADHFVYPIVRIGCMCSPAGALATAFGVADAYRRVAPPYPGADFTVEGPPIACPGQQFRGYLLDQAFSPQAGCLFLPNGYYTASGRSPYQGLCSPFAQSISFVFWSRLDLSCCYRMGGDGIGDPPFWCMSRIRHTNRLEVDISWEIA